MADVHLGGTGLIAGEPFLEEFVGQFAGKLIALEVSAALTVGSLCEVIRREDEIEDVLFALALGGKCIFLRLRIIFLREEDILAIGLYCLRGLLQRP